MNTLLSSVRRPVLDREQIKLAAAVTMTLNHFATVFLAPGTFLHDLLCGIGYFTAPVMCYFLTEAFRFTRDRRRYGLRLLIFGLLSQPPFFLAFRGVIMTSPVLFCLNVILTLFVCFLILCAMEYLQPGPVQAAAVILLVFLTDLMDWGLLAPLMVILFRRAEEDERLRPAGFAVPLLMCPLSTLSSDGGTLSAALCSMTGPLAAAVCILCFYNGTLRDGIFRKQKEKASAFSGNTARAAHTKWFFYLYYPVHLLILWAVHETASSTARMAGWWTM